jgi:hypothetical protein
MRLSSAALNFTKGFLNKQISRHFCHNIHAKSQEGSLTEKRADSTIAKILPLIINQNSVKWRCTFKNSKNPQMFGSSAHHPYDLKNA